jgi:hypothetical protein
MACQLLAITAGGRFGTQDLVRATHGVFALLVVR